MNEQNETQISINKGSRKIGISGNIMEEKWCTVKGATLKEVSDEFNKQWKDLK